MLNCKEFSLDNIDLNDPLSTINESIAEVMKKSVIQPGFEQQPRIANSNKSLRKQKLERKVPISTLLN